MDTESRVGSVEGAAAGCTLLLLSAGSSALVSSAAMVFTSACERQRYFTFSGDGRRSYHLRLGLKNER